MPLYEYSCRACGHSFEALIRSHETPSCPACTSSDLERLVSHFAVDSEGTRDAARQASMSRSVTRQAETERGEIQDWKRHH